MSDEDRTNPDKKEGQDDSIYSDILDALDSPLSSKESVVKKGASYPSNDLAETTDEEPQSIFPYAPDVNDPNAYPDFQGAKFYYDTRNYDNAIYTLINIIRAGTPTDQNMASELILEMAKNAPDLLDLLLPYLILFEDSKDPIIHMNINNSILNLREKYNPVINQLKESIKDFIQTYYKQHNTTYIPFLEILRSIGTSLEVIIKILEIQTKNREIPGKIDFTTQVFAYEPPGALFTCPHCGKELDKNATFCTHCNEDVFKCAICFRFIKNDELVRCPKCGSPAHEQHFLEWLKKTGACPVCQNKLYEQEVAKVTCVVCGLEIKSTEKPENLIKCPQCGALAHKDHWFDYVKIYILIF
ncbi:MAG: zinc ribbon domain-containing protein [Candidatus Helarchaeota archaeon]